jgi:hypothetical protein
MSKRMRLVGHVARMRRGILYFWVKRPEGKRSILGHRRRREDNIKMDLKRDIMGWYGLD